MATDNRPQNWGQTTKGEAVVRHCLQNSLGMRACFINYGATITTLAVPDQHGKLANIILSLPDLPAYLKTRHRHAAIIGRYAGRIARAEFRLNDELIKLPANEKGIALHGDPDGFDKRVWQYQDISAADSTGVRYTLSSPEGDQGMPGQIEVSVSYSLMKTSNELRMDYSAHSPASSKTTVTNLTNHAYFNLAGAGSRGLDTHVFQILADRYTETDAKRIPTGRILPVSATPLDLRQPTTISQHLMQASALLGNPPGYDHSLLFTDWDQGLKLVASISESTSGRQMDVYTTEPSVQFNSGNGFDGSELASEGRAYLRHDGFAFETQHLPDSPNHPEFPSTVLKPGQTCTSTTSLRFSLAGKDRQ